MLVAQGHVGPVLPVSDVTAAREFYEDRLGLRGAPAPGGYRLEAGGGTRVYLLEVPDDAGSGSWPLASFEVADLDAAVAELTAAGTAPLRMAGTGFELDEAGIARQEGLAVAWFADPDGNVFTVFQLAGD